MENLKPAPGRPPILIGGGGEKRTLRLVARYADEWNCVNVTPEEYERKLGILDRHCEAVGRDPDCIRRSVMSFGLIGPDRRAIDRATKRVMEMFTRLPPTSPAEYRKAARAEGMIVGTTDEAVDQLGRLAALGVAEIQLEHIDFDSDEFPEYLASEIIPRVAGL